MPRIDLPAGPVDYTDTGGDGPVLVFAHGLLMNETLWRSVIPLLQRDYRCIAPTLPLGAHRSPMRPDADLSQLGVARILADVLDALELTDATVVLNDWGGGQFLVSDGRADRVGRLVLASCEAFDNFPPRPARPAVALCRVPGGTRVFLRLLVTRFVRHDKRAWGGLSKAGIPDAVLDDWFAPATRSADIRRDLRKFCVGTPARSTLLEWASRLSTFDRPVLVVWATEDRMMPLSHARRLEQVFPNARRVQIDDSWTLLPVDQPHRFAAALRDFVPLA
ncbi:alpha/beta fold hydrolase [Rhodococcoides corynebacterioides]|uniref:Alpha/beta hydrolase n=1 Tax=Rhodococcoides corynebacterioides TaxID=53972 RepID=A0ABS7P8R4_9NOCA|nr:alpha/beta hydrolase [Rhodococcus corynebacterioides]MBY6368735.1 alpha/beta hydrolase [Rhodococcus corynebacterioides]MBY6409400.1 alpha/beta hydrolase [Rhodococcus corynebacterioides]